MKIWLHYLIGGALLQICLAKEVALDFMVTPGKAGKVEVALDTPPIPSSTCKFEWDSMGATVEVSYKLLSMTNLSLNIV